MNLEDSIKDVIQKKLSDGTVENIIAEKLENGIKVAMEDLFRSYGDVGKIIKEKISEVIVPAIEKYDFSDYIVKLDTVLTDIVNSTTLVENKKLLRNFEELMLEDDRRTITASTLFGEWCNYVAKEVETNGLEVVFDDEPSYENVNVTMTVEREEGREWSSIKKANIIFECEHDENMNFLIPISKWESIDGDKWTMDLKQNPDLNSLRYLNDFEVFLLKLQRSLCKVVLDEEEIEDDISPESEPEASFS
jgi:hypothetical protein